MLSNIIGLERGRAKFAYNSAISVGQNKEYKQWAKKIPMMIKANGLGSTLAFLKSKEKNKEGKKTEKGLLYEHISEWLKYDEKKLIELSNEELVEKIITLESSRYRAVTVEVLAFLAWLSRFAEGLIQGEMEEE